MAVAEQVFRALERGRPQLLDSAPEHCGGKEWPEAITEAIEECAAAGGFDFLPR